MSSLRLNDQEIRKFWEAKLREAGRDYKVDFSIGDSCLKIWQQRVERSGNKIAVETLGLALNFATVERISNEIAAFLSASDSLRKGDVVAILMPNISQYIVSVLGILKAGMIVCNINPLYTEREVEYQLIDSDSRCLFSLANVSLAASRIAAKTKLKLVVETELFDLEKFPINIIKNFVVSHVKKMVPPHRFPGELQVLSFRQALSIGASTLAQNDSIRAKVKKAHETVAASDPAFYQYTGGTTGVSKAAVLTQKNICYNAIIAYQTGIKPFFGLDLKTSQALAHGWIALPLPLYHIYSLHCFFLFTVMTGMGAVLIPNPRDLGGFVESLKSREFSVMPGIQTLFSALMARPDFAAIGLEKTYVLSAGMGLAEEVYKDWQKRLGRPIIEGYGLSECSPTVLFNPWNLPKAGSCGLPIGETLVKLRGEDGSDLNLGESALIGELLVKGPQVMSGYLGRPEETALLMDKEGWLQTGDLASIDEAGYVRIVGRKKEMMIVSGFNVYPDELEGVALATGLVLEAAAISLPDDKTGERIILFVVPKVKLSQENKGQEKLFKEQLAAELTKSLTSYKRPKEIRISHELPKSPIGKILRRLVKDQALNEPILSGETKH